MNHYVRINGCNISLHWLWQHPEFHPEVPRVPGYVPPRGRKPSAQPKPPKPPMDKLPEPPRPQKAVAKLSTPAKNEYTVREKKQLASLKVDMDALVASGLLYRTPDGRYGLSEWRKR